LANSLPRNTAKTGTSNWIRGRQEHGFLRVQCDTCHAEQGYLTSDAVKAGPMDQLLGHSITYRNIVGLQQGRKVLTLLTLPACDSDETFMDGLGKKLVGFSLQCRGGV